MKRIKYLIIPSIMIACIIGCSSDASDIKLIKPDQKIQNSDLIIPSTLQERKVSEGGGLNFPSSNELGISNGRHGAGMVYLKTDLYSYCRATGELPDSMAAFINSGFPLFWPRNVWDGTSIHVLTSSPIIGGELERGKISWEKTDKDEAQLKYVRLDYDEYKNSGNEVWKIYTMNLEYFTYTGEQIRDNPELKVKIERKGDGGGGATSVVGGTKPINDVTDPEKRFIYGMCGSLSDHLIGSIRRFYENNQRLPQTIEEAFLVSPRSEIRFLITENFQHLAQLLNKRNANFKIGFDYGRQAHYCVLTIDGEELISYCSVYGVEGENSYSSDNGIQAGCNMGSLDMSSPLISTANLGSIQFPEEIMISTADIVVSE